MNEQTVMAKNQRELWLLDLSDDYTFTKGTEEEVKRYLEKVVEDATTDCEFCHCGGVEKWKDKYLYAILSFESSFEDAPTIEYKAIPLRDIAAKPIEELLKECKKKKKE